MPDPSGSWIAPALEASARLVALPLNERGRALGEESAARGLAPLTLRRAIVAARYCLRHSKSVGLDICDVSAATLAVELLMRLEQRDRLGANAIRKAVFEGRLSVREMRKRLKATPEKRPRGRRLGDWAEFALSIIDQFYSAPVAAFEIGETSELGKMLHVDIEVTPQGARKPDAIFMSPLDDYSECAGLTVDDQFPFIMAAALVYPRINLVFHERAEMQRFDSLLNSVPRKLPSELISVLLGRNEDEAGLASLALEL